MSLEWARSALLSPPHPKGARRAGVDAKIVARKVAGRVGVVWSREKRGIWREERLICVVVVAILACVALVLSPEDLALDARGFDDSGFEALVDALECHDLHWRKLWLEKQKFEELWQLEEVAACGRHVCVDEVEMQRMVLLRNVFAGVLLECARVTCCDV